MDDLEEKLPLQVTEQVEKNATCKMSIQDELVKLSFEHGDQLRSILEEAGYEPTCHFNIGSQTFTSPAFLDPALPNVSHCNTSVEIPFSFIDSLESINV